MSLFRWVLIGYTVLVVVISVIPISSGTGPSLNEVEILSFRLDYLLHTAVFFLWGVLAGIYAIKRAENRKRQLITLFLIGIMLAVLTEYVQKYLPYRGYNINDLIGNVLGVVLSFGLFAIIVSKCFFLLYRQKKEPKKSSRLQL